VRCGALQVRGSLDASGGGGESRSKSPRRTSCFLEVPTDPMFRSRSRSLDDGNRVRVPPSDCEATYRIYDEIVKEGKSVCVCVCVFVYRDLQMTSHRTSASFTCSVLRCAEKALVC
jgi:hypothetical protein